LYHDIITIFEAFWLANYRESDAPIDVIVVVSEMAHDLGLYCL
jgi:hypothetical protein